MQISKPVYSVIIFLVSLVILFFFAWPQYKQIQVLQRTLVKKQAEYGSKYLYYTKVTQLVGDIESKSEAIQKVNNALPPDFSIAPLVYFFQKESTESGLVVKSISLSHASGTTKNLKSITFSLNLEGGYESLKNFLSSLSISDRLFETNSISVRPASPQQGSSLKNQQKAYAFELEVTTHAY